MAIPDTEAIQLIIESEPLPGEPTYISWKITGRNQEKVDDEANRLMHSVGSNGFASFSFPHLVRSGPFKGWFCSTGVTCDGEKQKCP